VSRKLGDMRQFIADVPFKDYVLIVGSGPSAQYVVSPEIADVHGVEMVKPNPQWAEITRDQTVILCNGAPPVAGADVFMAFDIMAAERGKWGNGKHWYGIPNRAKHYLIGHELAAKHDPGNDYYTFEYTLSLFNMLAEQRVLPYNPKRHTNPVDVPQKWQLHGGATITACAYQLALHYENVKAINLIGVEMWGAAKWDMVEHNVIRSGGTPFDLLIERAMRGDIYGGRKGVITNHIGQSFLCCNQLPPEAFYPGYKEEDE